MFMDLWKASLIILFVSGVICSVWNIIIHIRKAQKLPLFNPINVFSVCTFVAMMLMFFSASFDENHNNILAAAVSALFDTVDSISFGNHLSDVLELMFGKSYGVSMPDNKLYFYYAVFISLLAPVLTTRAVFMIFRDTFTQIRCLFNLKDSLHIFSELNEKSIILAKDIISKEKNCKLVFTEVNKKETDVLYIEQARKINALLTKKSVNGFRVIDKLSKKAVYFYYINKNGKNNIKYSLDKFSQIKNMKRKITIFLFSTEGCAEQVVDLANAKNSNDNVKIELINESQRLAYNLIFDHPIYDVNSDDKQVNIMIIGAGHNGLEFAKAISWCGQMLNRNFSVRIYDKEDKSQKITFPFNNLREKLKNIGTNLDVEFKQCDIFSKDFESVRLNKADYIVVDIGDDNDNLTAALLLREMYSKTRKNSAFVPSDFPSPKIFTVIEDENFRTIVEALNDSSIVAFGTINDIYSCSNILNWKIDKIGEFIHASYYAHNQMKNVADNDINKSDLLKSGIIDYSVQPEVNKRSSRAAAIHTIYKFNDLGINTNNLYSEENLKIIAEERDKLLRLEHCRWNVFQMLDGWEQWDMSEFARGKHKDKVARLHAYLAKFDDLKIIADSIYGAEEDPVEYDMVVIDSMLNAVAYGLYDIGIDEICAKESI